jgi:hypothetical protein
MKFHLILLVALLVTAPTQAITLVNDLIEIGKPYPAPEIEKILQNEEEGRLFTVNFVPLPNSGKLYVFELPGRNVKAAFGFKTEKIKIERGDAFLVTKSFRMMKLVEGEKTLVVALELTRLGTDGSGLHDKVFYKCEYPMAPGREMYDEEAFIGGMTQFFHSVVHQKRFKRPYAGQEKLESLVK